MNEFLTLISIGLALSLDAFSLALTLGTVSEENKKNLLIAFSVGIFHFLMPILGLLIGNQVLKIFNVKGDFFVAIILLYISFEMIRNIMQQEKMAWNPGIFAYISFAFSVSIDSFSVGLGLNIITSNIIFAAIIFSICSFSLTYIGTILGKYTKKRFGIIANIIGALLLLVLGIIHLL